jgi:hypothetical protein
VASSSSGWEGVVSVQGGQFWLPTWALHPRRTMGDELVQGPSSKSTALTTEEQL